MVLGMFLGIVRRRTHGQRRPTARTVSGAADDGLPTWVIARVPAVGRGFREAQVDDAGGSGNRDDWMLAAHRREVAIGRGWRLAIPPQRVWCQGWRTSTSPTRRVRSGARTTGVGEHEQNHAPLRTDVK